MPLTGCRKVADCIRCETGRGVDRTTVMHHCREKRPLLCLAPKRPRPVATSATLPPRACKERRNRSPEGAMGIQAGVQRSETPAMAGKTQ